MGSFSLWCIFGLILIMGNSHIIKAQDSPADYLKPHNLARAELERNITNLVWDNKIAAYAQNYADRSKDCKVVASNSGSLDYGESIAVSPGDLSGLEAVNSWVAEKYHYNHYSNICEGGECHHYTQVVWDTTLRLGCGKAKCDNGGTFIVCHYYPAGNVGTGTPY